MSWIILLTGLWASIVLTSAGSLSRASNTRSDPKRQEVMHINRQHEHSSNNMKYMGQRKVSCENMSEHFLSDTLQCLDTFVGGQLKSIPEQNKDRIQGTEESN